jgi:hypothetical protein
MTPKRTDLLSIIRITLVWSRLLLAVNACTIITITMARIFDTGSQMRAELKETI